MDNEYKNKLYDLITQILALVNDSVGGANAEKFGGMGALSMLVAAQVVYISKGYTKEELEDCYDVCEIISRKVIQEWGLDKPALGEVEATQKPADRYKN